MAITAISMAASSWLIKTILDLEDQMSARVEWTEVRAEESYWVIADLTKNGWEFWEKNAWEIRWYPMATTSQCVDKAERAIHACRQAA
jgi:hypothetical protein